MYINQDFMQIKKLTIASVVVILYGLIFLNSGIAQSIPEYNYDMLTSQNVHTIYLNGNTIVDIRDVKLSPDYYMHQGRVSFHGQLVSSVLFNNHIFVADQTNQRMYKVTHENKLARVTGGRGRGPGEFLDIFHLSATKNNLFAQDRNQLKTIVYNKNLEVVAELRTGNSGVIAAGEKYTLVPGGFSSNHFFEVIESKPPFSQVGEFLAHIIPVGMQPSGYKFSRAVTNRKGDFLITVNGLPYLFLFDKNLNHLQSIKLDNEFIRTIIAENPPLNPIQQADIQRGGVSNIVGGMYLTESRDILFGIRRTLYHLESVDGSYSLRNKYQFFVPGESKSETVTALGISNMVFLEQSKELCFVSIHFSNRYCFKFDLIVDE